MGPDAAPSKKNALQITDCSESSSSSNHAMVRQGHRQDARDSIGEPFFRFTGQAVAVALAAMIHLQPDCLFVENRFVADMGITIDDDGIVQHIGAVPTDQVPIVSLAEQALMPSFVNSHSHVFQRLLRARVEAVSQQASFWSWRKHMYALVETLTPECMEQIARYTFMEMVWSGYTTVKEFHYVHHNADGTPYDDPHEMVHRLIAAANEAQINMHLLRVAYPNAEESAQRRFSDVDIEQAIALTDDLRNRVSIPVGIAPHSIRAVSPDGFRRCLEWANHVGAECHAHVAEQPQEVAWAQETYGAPPLQLIADAAPLSPAFTAVHATHLNEAEIQHAGRIGVHVCFCPTTEANLGDGLPATYDIVTAGAHLAIGSDSQAEIDPFAELRLLEYNERNRLGRRCVLDPGALLEATTEPLAVGKQARLIAVDRNHPAVAGASVADLSSALVLGGQRDCISGVYQGATNIRRHPPSTLLRDITANL